LSELDQMKRDFVDGVTHDLKSPLAAVRTAAELAQTRVEEDVREEGLRRNLADKFLIIRENADRLRNLVTSILEVAKIESGLVPDKAPTSLEEVIGRVAATFRLLAERKSLAFDVVIHRPLPPVPADAALLERLLANLVGNAVKFTAKGRVTVELDGDDRGQTVRVTDSGPGIPPEARDKVFSKFFRVRRPGEKIEGSGLGLAIARGIAEAHGGSLSVDSRVEEGTAFVLSLPRR
jgi:signal transduction histidine kinase